ncbi:MAG TPA: hypothetical protein VEW48_11305 [Thermoanaerobaculia bacterium]|nr:hypothetical protein [Thermoanaerobaculia bacterium]
MASNFRELGSKKGYLWSLIGMGCVVSLFALFASYLPDLPDGFPKSIVALGVAAMIGQIAAKLQGEAISTHIASGGMKQTGWKATGITLAWLVVTVVVFIAVAVVADF